MSGPKIDELTLRQMEAERLERQRQERLRQIKLATVKYYEGVEQINNLVNEIRKYLQSQVLVLENHGDVSHILDELIKIKSEYVNKLTVLANKSPEGEVKDINEKREFILKKSEKLKNEFYDKTKTHYELLSKYLENEKNYEEKAKFAELMRRTEKKQKLEFQEYTEMVFIYDDNEGLDSDEVVENLVELINRFINEDCLYINHKMKILKIYSEILDLEKSDESQERKVFKINKIHEEFKQLRELISNELEEIRDLYSEYVSECILSTIEPKKIHDFTSIAQLKNEIKDLQEYANKKMVREYIKEQIDEVMLKHNFNIIKSDILRPAKKGSRELYGISDNVAINVFLSENNEVTMGVVAIGFDEFLKADENQALYEEQWNFCKLHPSIVADLEARGIIFSLKEHRLPDKKYNRKIKIKDQSEIKKSKNYEDTLEEKALELGDR